MLSSTVLEVAIGLVFCYASISLISSAIYEAIASLLKLRAKTLLSGVEALLNDGEFTGLARSLYNHALVNPRDGGTSGGQKPPAIKPSYIEPRSFAIALIESIQGAPGAFSELGGKIDAMGDPQLRQLLRGMYDRSMGKIENLQAELAGWFDAGMARVSGAYKRMAQLVTFLIALAIAGLFNVDTFHLFRTLWNHPALMAQVSLPDRQVAEQVMASLEMLPVGWAPSPTSLPLAVAGWLVTATTALFGAPFWFDLLKHLVNLRGTGGKPDEAARVK